MYKTYQKVLNTYWYCLLTKQARQVLERARQVLEQHNSFTTSMSKFQRVTMNLSSAIRKIDRLITHQLM